MASWGADGTIGAEPNDGWVMDKEKNLFVIGSGVAEITRFTRRMMVERLLAGAGAGAAWPLVATSHPIYGLLSSNAILDEVEKLFMAKEIKVLGASKATKGDKKQIISRDLCRSP